MKTGSDSKECNLNWLVFEDKMNQNSTPLFLKMRLLFVRSRLRVPRGGVIEGREQ